MSKIKKRKGSKKKHDSDSDDVNVDDEGDVEMKDKESEIDRDQDLDEDNDSKGESDQDEKEHKREKGKRKRKKKNKKKKKKKKKKKSGKKTVPQIKVDWNVSPKGKMPLLRESQYHVPDLEHLPDSLNEGHFRIRGKKHLSAHQESLEDIDSIETNQWNLNFYTTKCINLKNSQKIKEIPVIKRRWKKYDIANKVFNGQIDFNEFGYQDENSQKKAKNEKITKKKRVDEQKAKIKKKVKKVSQMKLKLKEFNEGDESYMSLEIKIKNDEKRIKYREESLAGLEEEFIEAQKTYNLIKNGNPCYVTDPKTMFPFYYQTITDKKKKKKKRKGKEEGEGKEERSTNKNRKKRKRLEEKKKSKSQSQSPSSSKRNKENGEPPKKKRKITISSLSSSPSIPMASEPQTHPVINPVSHLTNGTTETTSSDLFREINDIYEECDQDEGNLIDLIFKQRIEFKNMDEICYNDIQLNLDNQSSLIHSFALSSSEK